MENSVSTISMKQSDNKCEVAETHAQPKLLCKMRSTADAVYYVCREFLIGISPPHIPTIRSENILSTFSFLKLHSMEHVPSKWLRIAYIQCEEIYYYYSCRRVSDREEYGNRFQLIQNTKICAQSSAVHSWRSILCAIKWWMVLQCKA